MDVGCGGAALFAAKVPRFVVLAAFSIAGGGKSGKPRDGAGPAEQAGFGQRRLEKLQVSEIGAGCMSISANYGPAADKEQGI